MNVVFLMDPLETVDPKKDTTLALMTGAEGRGHDIFFLPRGGITLRNESIIFDVEEVRTDLSQRPPFRRGDLRRLQPEEVDVVMVRSDPPFSAQYLLDTWLLDRVKDHAVVVNDPQGLRAVNEKLWVTRFTDLVPPTVVSRRRAHLFDFLTEHTKVVAKPTDGYGGAGVFLVQAEDKNAPVIFEVLTHNWTQEIIVQRYEPLATEGDKRILLLGGDPIGAVLRVHGETDHRNNFFAGGRAEKTVITPRDREIIATLRPHLLALGLHFVGIDVIGGRLIEVNVTSPTCIQEIDALEGVNLEDQVMAYVEALVEARRGEPRTSP